MINASTKQDALKRLNRIEGQVRGVGRMVESERYCIDILQQVTAARRALDQVALKIMRRHLDSCVSEAIKSHRGRGKIDELMATVQQFVSRG